MKLTTLIAIAGLVAVAAGLVWVRLAPDRAESIHVDPLVTGETSPRSVLIFSVNFYDDATRTRLNAEPIQLTVFEACCTVPILGSGLTKTKEEQMEALSFNAARAVERTMRENAQWFGGVAEELAADDTIRSGNVLVDDPDLIAPAETAPGGS